MQRIRIVVRLDTPLLLGGSEAGALEPAGVIRPPSLRGLLRTFTRAYLGYLLGEVRDRANCIRTLESSLLGSAAEQASRGNTYRLALGELTGPLKSHRDYLLVPKPNGQGGDKGTGTGFVEQKTQSIDVVVPGRSLNNKHFPSALQSMLWIALTLGSLGKRSRRGYGSLSIVGSQATWANALALPTFNDIANVASLAAEIGSGLIVTEMAVREWIDEEWGKNDALHGRSEATTSAYVPEETFFQFAGRDHVYIGEALTDSECPWKELMESFNQACHQQKKAHPDRYEKHIGSGGSRRLASPVWMRIFKTGAGFVPVVTLSPVAAAKDISDALIASVQCRKLSDLIGDPSK